MPLLKEIKPIFKIEFYIPNGGCFVKTKHPIARQNILINKEV